MVMQFNDRAEAGRLLGERLSRFTGNPRVRVAGLLRGGMAVASGVAARLGTALAPLPVRTLRDPSNPALALGATTGALPPLLNDDLISILNVPRAVVDALIAVAVGDLALELAALPAAPAPAVGPDTIVIVVDDGMATGVTMRAALIAVRKQGPGRVIVAVPVAPSVVQAQVAALADEVICLQTSDPFFAIDLWYRDFAPVSRAAVRRLLEGGPVVGSEAGLDAGTLAELVGHLPAAGALVRFFDQQPQTALTAADLAYQIAVPRPSVDMALTALCRVGVLERWSAEGLTFYRLGRAPDVRLAVAAVTRWQATMLREAHRLADAAGASLPVLGGTLAWDAALDPSSTFVAPDGNPVAVS